MGDTFSLLKSRGVLAGSGNLAGFFGGVHYLHSDRPETGDTKKWRRRPDSNRGITVLQTVALATWLRRPIQNGRIFNIFLERIQGPFVVFGSFTARLSPEKRRRLRAPFTWHFSIFPTGNDLISPSFCRFYRLRLTRSMMHPCCSTPFPWYLNHDP